MQINKIIALRSRQVFVYWLGSYVLIYLPSWPQIYVYRLLRQQKLEERLISLLQFCMSFVDWFMASFLYCFPYSYRSSNYCDSNSCRSFTLLKALAKSNGNLFAIASKSERERQLSLSRQLEMRYLQRESHQKRSKELIPKRMQRGLRVITLQEAIEKSTILLSQYWKN